MYKIPRYSISLVKQTPVKKVRLWPLALLASLLALAFLWLIHTPEPARYCDEYTTPPCNWRTDTALGPASPLYGPPVPAKRKD